MIALITYDVPHKKTHDLMIRLMHKDVYVIAIPFKQYKKRKVLYSHRPNMNNGIDTRKLAEKLGFQYQASDSPALLMKNQDIEEGIIGGAGIIDPMDRKIINSHPGYLPYTRGLDALKWAIYKGDPIGVTTHTIDDNVDAGYEIERQSLDISYYDTFHSVAFRLYELEIDMLVRSLNLPIRDRLPTHGVSNMRMPIELEPIMMERFEKLRKSRND